MSSSSRRKRRQHHHQQHRNKYSDDDDDDEEYLPVSESEKEIHVYENGNRIQLDESTSKRNLLYTFNNDVDDYVDPYSDSDSDDDKRKDPDYSPEDIKRELDFISSVRTGKRPVTKPPRKDQPTKSEVIHNRSLKSIRYAWNEYTTKDEFHYVNEQEETTITSRQEYLNFETLLGTYKSMKMKKKKKKQMSKMNGLSVSEIIKGMEDRGYEFLKEPLDLRTGSNDDDDNMMTSTHRQRHDNNNKRRQYRYYRLKSDGILVIVADVQTDNYIGHFYAPKIIDQVASMVEATYRNPDFVKRN